MRGQATALGLALAAVLLAGCGEKAGPTGRPTPSGLPVPRYVSLKFKQVNARQGPGEDYKILWVYHAQGLPVQVVAETREWRKICDPDGQTAWVRSRVTDGRRTLMRDHAEPLALHASPKLEARITAYLAPHGTAPLDKCEDGWCRVKAPGAKGWVPQAQVWGADADDQCARAAPEPARQAPRKVRGR